MIASHFNTAKHKKKCLSPANLLFRQEFGSSSNLSDAFEDKCRENRELKKLNYQYKDELDKLKLKYDKLENLNIKLQEKITQSFNSTNIICENLIDI